MKLKQKVPTGVLHASSRPGFGAVKKSVKREYYVLPLSQEVNEAIAVAQKNIGGTETETRSMYLPNHTEKQDVYVVDKVLLQKIMSSGLCGYKIFYRRGENGMIYPYRSAEQKARARDRKAKVTLKKTRLVTTATS